MTLVKTELPNGMADEDKWKEGSLKTGSYITLTLYGVDSYSSRIRRDKLSFFLFSPKRIWTCVKEEAINVSLH
jgi:hypothetical protein